MKKIAVSCLFILLTGIFLFCSNPTSESEALYMNKCGSCHLANGEGVGELIPSLVNSELFETNRSLLICISKNGITKQNESGYSYAMPANEDLSETELTNILNYIRKSWYKEIPTFSLEEIQKNLETCN